MPQTLLIRNGRVIDPSQEIDETTTVAIAGGRIAAIGKSAPKSADRVIDAAGLIVAPGLIDMHVHLREPGQEQKETIASGTAAAVAGGFTAVACMPNTSPALDNPAEIEFVLRQAERFGHCRVFPIGALTKGRAGRELAEIGLMSRAGVRAFSDDGDGIADAGVCLKAMRYVAMVDGLFIQHCEDKTLSAGGCMNAGPTATRLGLPGLPSAAEDVMVQRDILLADIAKVRYHVAHVSTAGAVEMVRKAKAAGKAVSAEVCPHHLLLTDESCATYDTRFKMSPPLRSAADVQACVEGVLDGTIDCLVTDHAPHADQDKQQEFQAAPFGITGLETALGLFAKALVYDAGLSWPRLIELMSTAPARLMRLGIPSGLQSPPSTPIGAANGPAPEAPSALGTLRAGAAADLTLIDPETEWTFEAAHSRSLSRNTPFDGWTLPCRAVMTIVGGAVHHELCAQAARA